MNILVTGCAGFIGFHLCKYLLESSNLKIFGVDNINNYYSTKLKTDRLKILKKNDNFVFKKINLKDFDKLNYLFKKNKFKIVYNLAAQAGVRYSISNPEEYTNSNLIGYFNILQLSKIYKIKHLISASTSSVYGENTDFPLNEKLNTDMPISFYAATKKSNEVMSYSYSYIYKMKITLLRFFTVYGPYGRPDMSLFKFVKNIEEKKYIDLYNYGNHERDFTYIKDVVLVLKKIMNKPSNNKVPFQIFNVSSNNPISLRSFIKNIEEILNKKAKLKKLKLQKGDIKKTHGDNSLLIKKIGKIKFTKLKDGIKEFVFWYKSYNKK
tara:strand:- start:1420 stop:2388 length:969 start_codon:yes stop_codon:yes gene_type:complete